MSFAKVRELNREAGRIFNENDGDDEKLKSGREGIEELERVISGYFPWMDRIIARCDQAIASGSPTVEDVKFISNTLKGGPK